MRRRRSDALCSITGVETVRTYSRGDIDGGFGAAGEDGVRFAHLDGAPGFTQGMGGGGAGGGGHVRDDV